MDLDWTELEKFVGGALSDRNGLTVKVYSREMDKELSVHVPPREAQRFMRTVPLYGAKVKIGESS